MSKRLVLLLSLVVLCLLPATIQAGEPTPPPPPSQLGSLGLPPWVVETAPIGPQDPSASVPVTEPPRPGNVSEAIVIDMRKVPATPHAYNPNEPDRYHLQGEFWQYQGQGGKRQPLPATEPGNPPVELQDMVPAPDRTKATLAPGDHVVAFDGQSDTGWIPPDTIFAVGPEYVVEAVNSGFMVYTKTGLQTRAYTDFESFVSLPTPWAGFCYDPRVVYSQEYGKFLMLILGLDTTNLKSYFWILVSENSDPNGNWILWRIEASRGGAGSEQWLDFAGLGADHWGVYVTGNYYTFTDSYVSTALWSFQDTIYTGGTAGFWVWGDLRWPSSDYAFSLQPALPQSQNASGISFFVNDYSGSGTQVCLWQLSGPRYPDGSGNPTNLTNAAIDARTYYAIGMNVVQPGSATPIDGNDCRVMNAVYSQGVVYTSFTIDPDNDHSNSEAYIIALNTGASTKAWDFTIWNGSYYIFYPAVAVQGAVVPPNWAAVFSMTVPTATTYAGSIALVRDVAAATSSFWWDRTGDGPYVRLDGNGRNRWGDYTGAAYDWSSGHMWGAAEYAAAGNQWGTRIFARTLGTEAPFPYIHVTSPNGGESWPVGGYRTVTWDALNVATLTGTLQVWLWDGAAWQYIASPALTDTSYTWFPVGNFPTTTGRIFVGVTNGSTWLVSDQSDSDITIFYPSCSPDYGLSCGSRDTWANNGGGSTNVLDSYSCTGSLMETGPEYTYSFTAPSSKLVSIVMRPATADLDLMVLGPTCDPAGCTGLSSFGGTTPEHVEFNPTAGATYSFVVDGYYGSVSNFSIAVDCALFADGFESNNTAAWSATQP